MAEPISTNEVLSPSFEVTRYSYREEIPDDPYYEFEYDGYLRFKDLIGRLRSFYPDNYFPDDEVLRRMKERADGENKHITTYMASADDEEVGAAIGLDDFNIFTGKWLVMDPKFQNTQLTRKLLEAIKNDYDEVHILASTFGYEKSADVDKMGKRQQALVRYYERLGFNVDMTSDSYRAVSSAILPVPMVWTRPK